MALAGCGGGTLSHGALVHRADAICTAYRSGTGKLAPPRTYAQIVVWVGRTLPLYLAALEKLSALKPSAQDAPAVERWLADDRRVAAALRALGDAALRRDYPSTSAAAAMLGTAGAASRREATGLGLNVCSLP